MELVTGTGVDVAYLGEAMVEAGEAMVDAEAVGH